MSYKFGSSNGHQKPVLEGGVPGVHELTSQGMSFITLKQPEIGSICIIEYLNFLMSTATKDDSSFSLPSTINMVRVCSL
jgi:hypothetical protein